MDIEKIGQRLLNERERLSLKAVEVYKGLGVHQNTYKSYEVGKREMPITVLAKLWDMGFDVMYVLTGQRLDVLVKDAALNAEIEPMRFAKRLIHLPEDVVPENPADALLIAMYHVEEAMIQAGAIANNDYEYKDLAKIAVGMVDIVK